MNAPLIAVGDIHGDYSRLQRLMPILCASGRRIVFVGDYVNGGAQSRAVLDELTDAWCANPEQFVFLMGNHELALLDYLETGDFARFASMGGIPTIRSYVADVRGDVHAAFVSGFPSPHRAFLNALLPCWESGELLISHTGYAPQRPTDRGRFAMVAESHPEMFGASAGLNGLVVCGHYLQSSFSAHVSNNLICLDTGCGVRGGPLTAVRLPERDLITI